MHWPAKSSGCLCSERHRDELAIKVRRKFDLDSAATVDGWATAHRATAFGCNIGQKPTKRL